MTAGEWTRVWSADGERLVVEARVDGDHTRHRFRSNTGGDGAVVVVRREDQILFIRHDRPVIDRTLLELPRGQAEADDAGPVATAARELAEETGWELQHGAALGRVWPDTGLSGDGVNVVLADAARRRRPDGPEPEFPDQQWLDRAEITAAIREGSLRDAISLAALALVAALDEAGDIGGS